MKLLVPALGLSLLSVGCLQERELMDPQANLGIEAGGAVTNLAVKNGLLRGDFGARRGFDGEATEMTGTSDREFKTSSVVVTREEEGRGAGMVILWTNGKTLEQLELGRHDFAYDPESIDQDEVTANVCSGAAAGSIDYDQPADRGHIIVEDNPEGGRDIELHTETARLDPITGERDFSRMETSTTAFTFQPSAP